MLYNATKIAINAVIATTTNPIGLVIAPRTPDRPPTEPDSDDIVDIAVPILPTIEPIPLMIFPPIIKTGEATAPIPIAVAIIVLVCSSRLLNHVVAFSTTPHTFSSVGAKAPMNAVPNSIPLFLI